MDTKKTLLSANIVLVTNNIDPSMYNDIWFVKKGVFGMDEIAPGSINVPGFTNITSNDCQITIVPNQIQIKFNDINNIVECLDKRIKTLLIHVQSFSKALGINFVWKISDNSQDISSFSHAIFGQEKEGIYSYFTNPDSKLGAYFSQDIDKDIRLKLDIKPIEIRESEDKVENVLMASFNYHHNCDKEDKLWAQLEKWNKLKEITDHILCLI